MPKGTREQLEQDVTALANGLKAAHESGQTERARKIASAFRRAKGQLDLMVSNPGEYDPNSPEFQEKYGAASGSSGLERFAAGAGKAVADLGLGIRQRAADIASRVAPQSGVIDRGVTESTRDRLYTEAQDVRDRDLPLLNTGAGLAGNITGNVAALFPVGGLATSLPRAAGVGAFEGALMPSTSAEETGLNIATGGAFGAGGQLAARGLQRAVAPFAATNSARVSNAVDLLKREGVDLDAAQKTGSVAAQRLRSHFGDNPLTATRQNEFSEKQLRQFTRAVLRRIGADADEATPEVLDGAVRRIGEKIDEALTSRPPIWDDTLDAQMRELVNDIIPGSLSDVDARPLLKNIDDLMNSAIADGDMIIAPSVFTRIRSNLSNLRAKGNPLASDVEDIMLETLERSGGDRAGLRDALAQYRNWKIIENSIDKKVDKFISPARLSNTMGNMRNRAASLRGLGHPETIRLARLAEAGRTLLPETIGNSGTAGRLIAGQGVLGAGGFLGALGSGQDVGDAAAIGVGAAALPLLLQRGMLSQGIIGNYLSGGAPQALQNVTASPAMQTLIRQGVISGGLLGQ